jgi:uncharacterized protein involved in exopolysaccharide biosynthesis
VDDIGGWSGEESEQRPKRPGRPVDPHRIRRALWGGRFWLIGAAVFGVAFGFFWAKVVMQQWYETTVVLKYEGELQIAERERRANPYALGPAAEALHRESFLRKLRDESGMNVGLFTLAQAINYEPDFRAGTLHIGVSADTPEGSMEFAHLVTHIFLDYHRDRQARRIEEEIAGVVSRLESAEREASEARRKYNEFRQRYGISDLSTEQQSMVTSAASLRAESELAISEIRAFEARVASLQTQLAEIPKTSVVTSGAGPERTAYNQLRQELASARASLSEDHPQVQALQQQVNALGAQLRRGGSGDGVVGSNTTYMSVQSQLREAKSQLTTLRERQKGLSQMADKAQRRIESFSGIEGKASALLAEVEVNETLTASLRATEAALEDSLERPPSGFSVLDPGTIPEYPVQNKLKLIAILAISTFSVLLALAFVLQREVRGFRMQTAAEIAFWGNGPVLGATAWPRDMHGLDELVAGLDDFAPDAKGTLLIVGGTPGDASLARQLAQRMSEDWFLDGPNKTDPTARSSTAPKPGPLQTPPPSGPYPIGGSRKQSAAPARPQPSTALALRPVQLVRRDHHLTLEAWDGPFEGQALRRVARLADRVMVLVRSGGMTALELNAIKRRIGREHGVGYVVLNLPEDLHTLPDRAGPVSEFWGV